MSKIMFSCGPELANLVVNSKPVRYAWASNLDLFREVNSNRDQGSSIKLFRATQHPDSSTTVVAFATSPGFTSNPELVSSTALHDHKDSFPHVEFLCSKSNPSFSIDKAVVRLFVSHFNELRQLKDQWVNLEHRLVITGHALGGSIASLFTLWLLQGTQSSDAKAAKSSDAKAVKSRICITFGSPLFGDNSFQNAISGCPAWHSSFLHVVSDIDPVFSISYPPEYKPFGTFLFCSMSGCACFDDSNSVSILLALMKNRLGNQGLQQVDYGTILANLKSKVLVKGASDLDGRIAQTLDAEIAVQLQTIGITRVEQNSIANSIERHTRDAIIQMKQLFDPSKKLNDVKINMTQLEWYKKQTKKEGMGYYDSYKNGQRQWDIHAARHKKALTLYWEKMVEEVEKKPQKEGAAFRIRWIFAGTNYRRMVEPLDIAEFYKSNNSQGSYLESRPRHYKLLEDWHKLEEKNKDQKYDRTKAIGMTDDSCFWAYVEEAIKYCRDIAGALSAEQRQARMDGLLAFEEYLMDQIQKKAVSTEVFLRDSSLMKWWQEYEWVIGAHSSPFVNYMKSRKYVQYV